MILKGQHDGHEGKIIKMGESNAKVELKMNGEIVTVKLSKIVLKSEHKTESKRKRDLKDSHKKARWSCPGIKVRVIKEGSLYNQKVCIIDVPSRKTIQIKDLARKSHFIKEKYLETIIPAINESVMIVKGDLRGV